MTIRHAAIGVAVLFVVCVLAALYTLYILVYPFKTITINNFQLDDKGVVPIHIETPVVHPGDVIRYKLDYCKFTDVTPIGKGQLIDGQIIPLTPSSASSAGLPMGCHITEREVTIPETINPGRYYFNKELDYPVNPIRTIKVFYYTEYFQVVGQDIPSTSRPPASLSTLAAPLVADQQLIEAGSGQLPPNSAP